MVESPQTRVLIVDDAEASRYTLARMLTKARYAVTEAATGDDALRQAAAKPDLIILDVNLPDVSGREVCRRLKADPATASIPVLHLSASYVDSDNRAEGLEGGADGYLTYPVEPRELVATIEALLRARRAEREARQQRELLRITLDSIGDAVIATDTTGKVTFLNGVAQALTGWSAKDAAGRPLADVFHIIDESTGEPAESPVDKALAEGRVVGLANNTVLTARDGTQHVIDDSAAPIRDEMGRVLGVILTFRDLTQQRSSELAIQDARDYAENIVDTVREPLLVLSADLRVRSASRSFYQTFRVAPAETVGRLVYELGNGQWRIPALRQLLEQMLPDGAAFQDFEVNHDFPGIGARVMMLNARRMYRERNHTELILLAIEDITERRRAEHGLRESEERFRVMVEGVKDYAIILLDAGGRVAGWNDGAARTLGYEEGEILGKSVALFFTEHDRNTRRPERELGEAAATGAANNDLWMERKDGSRFWASGTTTPLRAEGGQVRGFVKILRDLTERKRLEDALRNRAEQLMEADRRKDEFLAMLAHELRNPLAPLRNALNLERLADPNPKTTIRDGRAIMERQIEQLVRLVDDLLDISRITRGKIQLDKERVDLALVMDRAIEGSRPSIEARRHVLEATLPPETLPLDADPVRLAQIFQNLLTNAAKYTPEGGRIRLTAEKVVGRGGSSGKTDHEEIVVRVRDTGIGIAPEMLPKVFDLFTQAERSLARAEGGLGIGLTLVRRLTEMHGGSVEAHSEGVGRGSEFVVRLPVAKGPASAAERGSEKRRAAASSRRILVVDDNLDSVQTLAMLLQLMGHDARTAIEGRLALETAASFRPDVVLLDIGLPGMDGLEVCRRLRKEVGLKDAIIVAMTGYGQEEDKRRSHEAGFNTHLVKPVDLDALQELLAAPPLIATNGSGRPGSG
jgi:PAS domain S-box-containing protein